MIPLKAAFRFLLFSLWSILIVPLQLLVKAVNKGHGIYMLPRIWHKGVCAIFGIKVHVEGAPLCDKQVVFVSNHISYLDIPVIGSFLKASFVAKSEVARWPVFGFLSKLQNTAFITRNKRDAARESNNLLAMIERGCSLIIFPEGTSTDGQEVRVFKSGLFTALLAQNDHDLMVQPFSIEVLSSNKVVPQTQEDRDYYAWHINMDTEMPDHLWNFAKGHGAEIALKFHEPIAMKDYEDRRALLGECRERVVQGLNLLTPPPTIAS